MAAASFDRGTGFATARRTVQTNGLNSETHRCAQASHSLAGKPSIDATLVKNPGKESPQV